MYNGATFLLRGSGKADASSVPSLLLPSSIYTLISFFVRCAYGATAAPCVPAVSLIEKNKCLQRPFRAHLFFLRVVELCNFDAVG